MTASYRYFPDLVILLGLRAWMSLVGLFLMALGGWCMDREWDDFVEESPVLEARQDQENNAMGAVGGGGGFGMARSPISYARSANTTAATSSMGRGISEIPNVGSSSNLNHSTTPVSPHSHATTHAAVVAATATQKTSALSQLGRLSHIDRYTMLEDDATTGAASTILRGNRGPNTFLSRGGNDDDDTTQQHPAVMAAAAASAQQHGHGVVSVSESRRTFWARVAFLGYCVLAGSLSMDRHAWWGVDGNGMNACNYGSWGILFSLAILQTIWMRVVLSRRQMSTLRYLPLMLHVLLWIGLGVLTILGLNPEAPRWMAMIGVLGMAFSPVVMWWSRKRGDAYNATGQVPKAAKQHYFEHALKDLQSNDIVVIDLEEIHDMNKARERQAAAMTPSGTTAVFNFGGPLLACGALWFWVSLNTIHAVPDYDYLPIYQDSCWMFAWIAAAAIILLTFMTGHAHDEQGQQDEYLDKLCSAMNEPPSRRNLDKIKKQNFQTKVGLDGTTLAEGEAGAGAAAAATAATPAATGSNKDDPKNTQKATGNGASASSPLMIDTSNTVDELMPSRRRLSQSTASFGLGRFFFGCCSVGDDPSRGNNGIDAQIALTLAWTALGVAPCLTSQYYNHLWGALPFLEFLTLAGIGVAVGVLYRLATKSLYYHGMPLSPSRAVFASPAAAAAAFKEEEDRWILVFVGLFGVLVILMAIQGTTSLLLGLMSSALILYGLYQLQCDRKRFAGGNQLASANSNTAGRDSAIIVTSDNETYVNPNYTVYSFGSPLFALGVSLLAWSLSMP